MVRSLVIIGRDLGRLMCPLGAGNAHFCAVGLDRFLRVWSLGAGGRRPVHKMYLKSRLNCVLMCKHFDPDKEAQQQEEEGGEKVEVEDALDDSVEIISDTENAEEEDEVWDNMVVINSNAKRKHKSDKPAKRTKLK